MQRAQIPDRAVGSGGRTPVESTVPQLRPGRTVRGLQKPETRRARNPLASSVPDLAADSVVFVVIYKRSMVAWIRAAVNPQNYADLWKTQCRDSGGGYNFRRLVLAGILSTFYLSGEWFPDRYWPAVRKAKSRTQRRRPEVGGTKGEERSFGYGVGRPARAGRELRRPTLRSLRFSGQAG
jgi:hypothetical protein